MLKLINLAFGMRIVTENSNFCIKWAAKSGSLFTVLNKPALPMLGHPTSYRALVYLGFSRLTRLRIH